MLINKKDGASYEECRHYQDFDCTLCGVTRHMNTCVNNDNILFCIAPHQCGIILVKNRNAKKV